MQWDVHEPRQDSLMHSSVTGMRIVPQFKMPEPIGSPRFNQLDLVWAFALIALTHILCTLE